MLTLLSGYYLSTCFHSNNSNWVIVQVYVTHLRLVTYSYIIFFLCLHLDTTDVQAVSLNRVGINTYSIRCHYLNNSDVTGCMYVLVSELEELKNITGVIDRNNAEGAIYDLADIGCYDDLLAYGYHDEDGRTGNLPIVLETDLRVCRISKLKCCVLHE